MQRVLHTEHGGGDPCGFCDFEGQFSRRGNVDEAARGDETLSLAQRAADLQRTGAHRQQLTQVSGEASGRELFLSVGRGEVEPGQYRRGVTDRVTVRLVAQRGPQHDIGDVAGRRIAGRRDQGCIRARLASGSQCPHRRRGQPAVRDRDAQPLHARCQSLVRGLARLSRARRDRGLSHGAVENQGHRTCTMSRCAHRRHHDRLTGLGGRVQHLGKLRRRAGKGVAQRLRQPHLRFDHVFHDPGGSAAEFGVDGRVVPVRTLNHTHHCSPSHSVWASPGSRAQKRPALTR